MQRGWRRFGYFFFRPCCDGCRECVPIRIPVKIFTSSKSQRRVIRKNRHTIVKFQELQYKEEIYEIYRQHSLDRFAQETNKENFVQSFFPKAVSALQAEYYHEDNLSAVGFLDLSSSALSSVYFIYLTAVSFLSPGTYGVLKEIELAASIGLKYYYLGYYISGNHSMAYKNCFKPYELYNWEHETWHEMAGK